MNKPFDPKTCKFPYPMDTDKHYLHVKKNRGIIFDSKYPYVDNSKAFRFKQSIFRAILVCIAFPIASIRMNLRIKGRENLKKHKEIIKNGVISVCNHVHMWDYISLMNGIRRNKPHILAWAPNINGENGTMIRMVGGIPVPENDVRATATSIKQTMEMINNGGWLHVYAEGSMWEFYQPIRPFKPGAAYYACKCNKPIIPLAYSYRENGWLRKKIFKSPASYTLNIGEPIYPDMSLEFKQAEEKLTIEAHDAVCKLAGIDPKDNIYNPVFKNDKRIDYYTNEYGIGYKKSW